MPKTNAETTRQKKQLQPFPVEPTIEQLLQWLEAGGASYRESKRDVLEFLSGNNYSKP